MATISRFKKRKIILLNSSSRNPIQSKRRFPIKLVILTFKWIKNVEVNFLENFTKRNFEIFPNINFIKYKSKI